MIDNFKKYLDNSQDADALILELQDNPRFWSIYQMMEEADANDTKVLNRLFETLNSDIECEECTQSRADFFTLIREVWDIAYSYGFKDFENETLNV